MECESRLYREFCSAQIAFPERAGSIPNFRVGPDLGVARSIPTSLSVVSKATAADSDEATNISSAVASDTTLRLPRTNLPWTVEQLPAGRTNRLVMCN
jgi:hypothetical protein